MRRNRRMYAALAVLTGLSLVSAACGSSSKTTTNTSGAASVTTGASSQTTAPAAVTTAPSSVTTSGPTVAPGQKIGLLYDITGRGDKSFNDAAAAGLDKAKTEFKVVAQESTPTAADGSDRKDRLETVVAGGNKLVIGVGFLWNAAITQGSQDHTDTKLGVIHDASLLPGPDGK